jgi:hypothetical protein
VFSILFHHKLTPVPEFLKYHEQDMDSDGGLLGGEGAGLCFPIR